MPGAVLIFRFEATLRRTAAAAAAASSLLVMLKLMMMEPIIGVSPQRLSSPRPGERAARPLQPIR